MESRLHNVIQLFNEILVLLCVWLMFLFTDYVPDPVTRYDLAWKLIYLVAFAIGVNLLLLVIMIAKDITRAYKVHKAKKNVKQALN